MTPELKTALACAVEWMQNATPEQLANMRQKQRESFARAFGPCEHGNYDWETCPECLSAGIAEMPGDEITSRLSSL